MPGTPQTQTEWEQTVARRVMERTRSTLYIALRYLNAPLGALAPTPDPDPQRGLATNGAQLFYGASWALRLYRNNRRYLQRAYLHSLFHCLFRHPWLRGSRDKAGTALPPGPGPCESGTRRSPGPAQPWLFPRWAARRKP